MLLRAHKIPVVRILSSQSLLCDTQKPSKNSEASLLKIFCVRSSLCYLHVAVFALFPFIYALSQSYLTSVKSS